MNIDNENAESRQTIIPRFRKIINRETALYLLCGIGTMLLNIFVFWAGLKLNVDYRYANITALIITKLAAYLCNKVFVFQSHCKNFTALLLEFLRFLASRGFTMILDYFGLILMLEVLHTLQMASKIFITAVVVVINYFLGKKCVFINH